MGEDEPILTYAYFWDGLVQPPTRTGVSNPRFEAVRMEVAAKLRVWGPCRPRKEGGGRFFPTCLFREVPKRWELVGDISWRYIEN